MNAFNRTICGITIYSGISLICGCDKQQHGPVSQSTGEIGNSSESKNPTSEIELKTEFPEPVTFGTPFPRPRLPVHFDPPLEVPPKMQVPSGTYNMASGRPVRSNCPKVFLFNPQHLTDGDKREDNFVEMDDNLEPRIPRWVQVDLGIVGEIYAIWLWHVYSIEGWIVPKSVIVQVSNDPDFNKDITTVFNNDYDNSTRLGIGKDPPYATSRYGKLIPVGGKKARYVRVFGNGTTRFEQTCIVELEVYGLHVNPKDGEQGVDGKPFEAPQPPR